MTTSIPSDEISERQSALDWLLGRINYERTAVIPYGERQLKLDRIRQLLTKLGSPDAGQRIIHIAGTKGKGSTAAMVASMLTAAGHKTGVYSSPHLEHIEQRFAIDGVACSPQEFVALVNQVRPAVEQMDAEAEQAGEGAITGPTFFDITTAMALVYFAQQQVDATVLEVGLGGRLDSTNVCLPVVSAITCIGLDHIKQLGNTLELIAAEKAGIIKPGVPVVCGETQPGPRDVIAQIARQQGCRLIQRGCDYDVIHAGERFDFWRTNLDQREQLAKLELRMLGRHQQLNGATALAIIGELVDQGWAIPEAAQRAGLRQTTLPARVEWFAGKPSVLIDAAHNPASAVALAEAIRQHVPQRPRTLLLAGSRDKDIAGIVRELAPEFDQFVVTKYLENPRAVEPKNLQKLIKTATAGESTIKVAATPQAAWLAARSITPAEGVIVITGSFFIAAELRPTVMSRQSNAKH